VIALIAGALGFGGVAAAGAVGMANLLFGLFLALALALALAIFVVLTALGKGDPEGDEINEFSRFGAARHGGVPAQGAASSSLVASWD